MKVVKFELLDAYLSSWVCPEESEMYRYVDYETSFYVAHGKNISKDDVYRAADKLSKIIGAMDFDVYSDIQPFDVRFVRKIDLTLRRKPLKKLPKRISVSV